MFIDTHCHLTAFSEEELPQALERAKAVGVTRFICIGEEDALRIAETYDCIWAAVAVHPNEVDPNSQISKIEELAASDRVVAIGETGLDTYRGSETIEDQRRFFREAIALARNLKKPLAIHSRATRDECYQMLVDGNARDVGGVFHCYGEDAEFAKKLAAINFRISLPGILTFKASHKLREEVAKIPLDQILLETDMPYLAPEPVRGRPCEPSYLPHTAKKLAEVMNVSVQEIARVTTKNAEMLFRL